MSLFKKKTVEKTAVDAQEISPESAYEGWYRESLHTGSRVICNPPPEDTDDDYLFLCNEGSLPALEKKLLADGFKIGGSGGRGVALYKKPDPFDFSAFASYKKGSSNIILTMNPEYFTRFGNATKLAKRLNLLKKEDRVTLFEAVVRDQYPKEEMKYDWRNRYIRNIGMLANPFDNLDAARAILDDVDAVEPAEPELDRDIEANQAIDRAWEAVQINNRVNPPQIGVPIRGGEVQAVEVEF